MVQFCTRCFYHSEHPLNITFDEDGVCSGCRVHEEKDILDWNERGEKLGKILKAYKNTSGNNYDCIIPVSSARDSWFIVHSVKKVYGMNPLLVTYNKHYNTEVGIRNLAYLRDVFDCDLLTLTVDPDKVKKINRATIRKMGSIYWHCLAGQTVFPVQIAVRFKIPLIVWGAHQGVDQVGMFSHLDEVEMTRKYRKEHDLMGFEAEDLIDDFDFIRYEDVVQYMYPDDKELEKVGVRGIYLNNYIRWDTKAQHELMIEKYGYKTALQTRTFDTYNDTDCFNYSDLHDYLKFIKHGYGKVVDHVNREIRLRRLTREQGRELINRYIYKKPENTQLFMDWMGMTENAFWFVADQHRRPFAWTRNDSWQWDMNFNPAPEDTDMDLVNKVRLPLVENACEFHLSQRKPDAPADNKYIIIGKGHPDKIFV